MKKLFPSILLFLCVACSSPTHFATIESTQPYIGTNFWYGAILASTGQGGDRARLVRELDTLQALGLTNLRILVGADGPSGVVSRISPTLQLAPGVYNDTILDGLDFLLAEMGKRNMQAVLYLNNAWEWSGGYEQYLSWATGEEPIIPALHGWPTYMSHAGNFCTNAKAQDYFYDYVRFILTRTNRYTHRAYCNDPAIFAWEIGNEPRAFSDANKRAFVAWLKQAAVLIKQLDPNHLLTIGSEGVWGCENDSALCREIHAFPEVDYMTCHIWPYNWSWTQGLWDEQGNIDMTVMSSALDKVQDYIDMHRDIANRIGKPFVIEEFGFPRDYMSLSLDAPTTMRDMYYTLIFRNLTDTILNGYLPSSSTPQLLGVNFWGWAGEAVPIHRTWQTGDPYTGDPAQEDQGLNSVFLTDTTTLSVISMFNIKQ